MKLSSKSMQKVLIAGVLSGMRTSAGLLFTGLLIRQLPGNYFSSSRLIKFFGNPKTIAALSVGGAAELVIDKLPATPARISKGGLPARIAAGALCGATINSTEGKRPLQGAVAGGIAAIASAYAFYYARKELGKATGIPDPFIGAAEDLLAGAGGIALLKSD